MLKNTLVCATIALSTIISSNTQAATQDVGASVTTHGAIAFSNVQDISFGHIDYDAVHKGGLALGTDGNLTLGSNSVGLVLSGSVNQGSITVSNDGSTMEISCDHSATLANTNGDLLAITPTEIINGAGVAFGEATRCRGVGTDPLIASGLTELKIGAQLVVGAEFGSSDLTGGTYNTSNAGGDPITVSVVYQ